MAAPQNFRSALNGFHKEDVVKYLEYINTKHNNQINQLTMEVEELRSRLIQQPDEDLLTQLEALREENAVLSAKLEEAEAAKLQLEEKLNQQPEVIEEETPDLAAEELEAYRRAERTEREARERAELVYYQANGILTETTAKVDGIAEEITEMADQVMGQLTQMQMLVSSSKHALQDAASMLNTIRPNK